MQNSTHSANVSSSEQFVRMIGSSRRFVPTFHDGPKESSERSILEQNSGIPKSIQSVEFDVSYQSLDLETERKQIENHFKIARFNFNAYRESKYIFENSDYRSSAIQIFYNSVPKLLKNLIDEQWLSDFVSSSPEEIFSLFDHTDRTEHVWGIRIKEPTKILRGSMPNLDESIHEEVVPAKVVTTAEVSLDFSGGIRTVTTDEVVYTPEQWVHTLEHMEKVEAIVTLTEESGA